jgi:hypothetical protein
VLGPGRWKYIKSKKLKQVKKTDYTKIGKQGTRSPVTLLRKIVARD